MTHSPFRLSAVLLIPVLGFVPGAFAQTVDGTSPPAVVTDNANAAVPVASVAPAGPGQPVVSDMVHTDSQGHHLAPHGTFYLLDYVSVKTDKGVEGFVPGQEVHLVEVHRATHTLVVSDGRAQVEVAPEKLTHDMDIAALARRNDQANQNRIAAYIQSERDAYAKYEKQAAEATAKDVERNEKKQVAASTIVDNSGVDNTGLNQTSQPVDASVGGNGYGYYNSGSYGYGSPYSYFGGGDSVAIVNPGNSVNPATVGTASANSPTAGNVARGGGSTGATQSTGASSSGAAHGTAGKSK